MIGGRMGFVQFPGSAPNDPPKSGPGVAQQLQHLYSEYLQAFDSIYISSVLHKGLSRPGVQQGGASVNPQMPQATGITPTPANNMQGANQVNMVRL